LFFKLLHQVVRGIHAIFFSHGGQVLIDVLVGGSVAFLIGFVDEQFTVDHHLQCLLLDLFLIRFFTVHLLLHLQLLQLRFVILREFVTRDLFAIDLGHDIGDAFEIWFRHFFLTLLTLLLALCSFVLGVFFTVCSACCQGEGRSGGGKAQKQLLRHFRHFLTLKS